MNFPQGRNRIRLDLFGEWETLPSTSTTVVNAKGKQMKRKVEGREHHFFHQQVKVRSKAYIDNNGTTNPFSECQFKHLDLIMAKCLFVLLTHVVIATHLSLSLIITIKTKRLCAANRAVVPFQYSRSILIDVQAE